MEVSHLAEAVADPARRERYQSLVCGVATSRGCLVWMGAVAGAGHGRFWIGSGRVVIAHRYGFAVAHGVEALTEAEAVLHVCDEPICQNPEHLVAGTIAGNTADGITRRLTVGNPLRDTRGPRGRAVALRDAARLDPASLDEVAELGIPVGDALQVPLPLLP